MYFMYKSVIEASIQILYALFLGEWVDKHGCRLTILLPLYGSLISALYMILLTLLPSYPTPLIVLTSLPIGLSGGTLAFNISTFSYISRISTSENRSFRMTMAEGSAMLGSPIGLLVAAQVRVVDS
jgi:MFS family permease